MSPRSTASVARSSISTTCRRVRCMISLCVRTHAHLLLDAFPARMHEVRLHDVADVLVGRGDVQVVVQRLRFLRRQFLARHAAEVLDDRGMQLVDVLVQAVDVIQVALGPVQRGRAGLPDHGQYVRSHPDDFHARRIERECRGTDQRGIQVPGFDSARPGRPLCGHELRDEPGEGAREPDEDQRIADVEDGMGIGYLPRYIGRQSLCRQAPRSLARASSRAVRVRR